MTDPRSMTRRVFLTRVGSIALSLGGASLWLPRRAFGRNPYEGGVWLAGDHHVHTKYSPDGQYEIEDQIAAAARHGLAWCVITDHGGPMHDKVALEQAYPDLVAARRKYPRICVFQGMEWNVPAAEHGTVILPPTPDEAQIIADFERRFDEKNLSMPGTPANREADAVAAVKYLEKLKPAPLFFANHPARRGRNSPSEMRSWSDAGPNVFRGFEGAAGHQAVSLFGLPRGGYDKKPSADSWKGYPLEAYRTHGGFDWYVTKVGGLWDSMLGEGRPWYITANSDSHRHWTDHTKVNEATYPTHGHVTPTTQKSDDNHNEDFWPGEYTKTWVYAASAAPLDILAALRSGSMFPVHGDLIDRLEFAAQSADARAPMGGTLVLERGGDDVEITIRLRTPTGPNGAGRTPKLHHVDLIMGRILGPAQDVNLIENPTTRVIATFTDKDARREGPWRAWSYKIPRSDDSYYIRLRGTNHDYSDPPIDKGRIDPWEDLWLYSNPIFVRVTNS